MTPTLAGLLLAAMLGRGPSNPPKESLPKDSPPKDATSHRARAPKKDPRSGDITIVAAGHLVLGTDFPSEHPMMPRCDGEPMAASLSPLFADADIALANLAAPITTRANPTPYPDFVNTFAFRMPPRMGPALKTLGLDVVLSANNHALDFGVAGHHETLAELDALGIGHVGHVGEVWTTTIRGKKVAVVGFTQPYIRTFQSMRDVAAAAEVVKAARADTGADLVIALVHGGGEGREALHVPRKKEYVGHEARGRMIDVSHALVDAGADLVLGFGAHAPRAMEIYKDRLIDYALGNFVTYGPFDIQSPNHLTLVLRVTLEASGKLREAQIVPLRLRHPGFPESDPEARVVSWLQRYSRADFPDSAPVISDDGLVTAPVRDAAVDAPAPKAKRRHR
ncbi:MAG: CapA family protein [Myxococcota bacterium]